MAKEVKKEFERENNEEIIIGNINKVSSAEFMQALKLIKTDKATSYDCVSDFIIKKILMLE